MSGGTGFAIGLTIGLAVAAAVYLHDRRSGSMMGAATSPMSSDPAPASAPPAPASQRADSETQLEFYEMLPKFEVVIPERESDVRASGSAQPVERPGSYVLQAGSFRNPADADRMRAVLALQGIESKVQQVAVDNDTWHRVRIGPTSNLRALDETRRKLRAAQIDALVIRVGD